MVISKSEIEKVVIKLEGEKVFIFGREIERIVIEDGFTKGPLKFKKIFIFSDEYDFQIKFTGVKEFCVTVGGITYEFDEKTGEGLELCI